MSGCRGEVPGRRSSKTREKFYIFNIFNSPSNSNSIRLHVKRKIRSRSVMWFRLSSRLTENQIQIIVSFVSHEIHERDWNASGQLWQCKSFNWSRRLELQFATMFRKLAGADNGLIKTNMSWWNGLEPWMEHFSNQIVIVNNDSHEGISRVVCSFRKSL